jgi:hypothetical protein
MAPARQALTTRADGEYMEAAARGAFSSVL